MTEQTQAFRLPDVGEGLTEAEIVAWHVAVGDRVEVNQVLVEIETAKSIVELPSPFEGRVVALLAAVGDTVPVGEAIIEVGTEGAVATVNSAGSADSADSAGAVDSAGAADTAGPTAPATPPEEEQTPKLLVGYGATDPGSSSRRRRRAPATSSGTAAGAAHASVINALTTPALEVPARPATPAQHEGALEKPRAKPPVRGLAKQLGIDLATVEATGPNGTISRDDVRRAADGPASQAAGIATGSAAVTTAATSTAITATTFDTSATTAAATEPTRIPIKGVRKATAAAMVQSAFTAPHVTEFITIDVTPSLELIAEVQQRREFKDIKLTPLSLIARAYLRAISRTPMATAHWDEEAQEIVLPGTVNLGIAAATPRGLLVPNIKGAERLGWAELAAAIGELAATARAGKTQPADLAGGSTTITNIGVFGIDTGTPILNPGETAILAVGAIQRRPWVVGTGEAERIEPRSVMQLALSFDHRVLDGAEGSRLLADTAEILANPGLALL